jgi:CheY-like chemotaxis protein
MSSQEKEMIDDSYNVKVLLVEDNAINRLVVTKFLSRKQITPDIAENGEQAVQMVMKNVYDLVFMDLQMPMMDGFEATKIIRSMEDIYFKKLPIIALTADAMQSTKEKVMQHGMTDFLSKPFSAEEIYQLVVKYTKEKHNTKHIVPPLYQKLDPRLTDEVSFQLELSQLYIQVFEEFISKVTEAVAEKNAQKFRFAAHKIKSSIEMLELTELQEQINLLKVILTENNTEKINECKDKMIAATMNILTTLKKNVDTLEQGS